MGIFIETYKSMKKVLLNLTYRTQTNIQKLNFVDKKKCNYFHVNGFLYEEQHLSHFCNLSYKFKISILRFKFWSTIRINIMYKA